MVRQKHRAACACAYTDLDAHTGEHDFFNSITLLYIIQNFVLNKLAYNIGSKVDLKCTI